MAARALAAGRRRCLHAFAAWALGAAAAPAAWSAAVDADDWGDAPPSPPNPPNPPLPPMVWPDLALLNGQTWPGAGWVGQPAVVVVFATWCPFCRRHLAAVQALRKARPGLRVLGLAQDRGVAAVQAYLARQGASNPLPVVMDSTGALRSRLTARRTLPMTVLLDGQGRVGPAIPGEMTAADLLALNPRA